VSDEPPRTLDLRGEVCPFTFARTRLALEAMAVGQTLCVIVDNAASARNVPRSIEAQGQDVLEVREEEGRWSIVVEKIRDW
jgi:TusA-related sulfurtransferase